MKKLPLKILLILVLAALPASPSCAASGVVHVLLGKFPGGVISGASMTALAKDRSVSLSGSYNVRLSGGKLRVGSQNLSLPVTVSASQPITWNGARYYGQITFASAEGGFYAGNKLDLELYLCGVLRAEMHQSWPSEALKAQAVIARTYVVRNRGAHGAYDACASTHCQDYGGASADDANLSAAVAATKGAVLHYGGATAATFYHSDSGGMVTRAGAVWNSDYPYLKPTAEPVSYTSPNTTWEVTLPMSQLQAKLSAGGVNVGTIQSLTPVKRDESGRVEQLQVHGSGGVETITGNKFRTIVGGTVIKSTLFEFGTRTPYTLTAVSAVENRAGQRPAITAQATVQRNVSLSQLPAEQDDQLIWMTENKIFTTQELMEMLAKPDQRDKYIEIGIARIKGEKTIPAAGSTLEHPRAPARRETPAVMAAPALSMAPATGNSITFYGRGYGHGVGLSQWGAKAMAENGWTYDRILSHYFPGTVLAQ